MRAIRANQRILLSIFRGARQGAGLLLGVDVVAELDPRGIDYYWMRFARSAREKAPDSETAVIAPGGISVTPLFLGADRRRCIRYVDRSIARLVLRAVH